MLKEIPKSDIITRPIKVYKEWTLDENDINPIFGINDEGSLVDVDRAAETGDNVVIDLEGLRDGAPVAGLNVDEWTYEIGRGWVAPGFDEQLTGAKKGDVLRFNAVPNGTEEAADFVVTVNRVQTLELPELTDEWVEVNIADSDTVVEWRQSLRDRYTEMRVNQMRRTVVDRLTDELAKLVEIEAPESMVGADMQARVQNTIQQFQQHVQRTSCCS